MKLKYFLEWPYMQLELQKFKLFFKKPIDKQN